MDNKDKNGQVAMTSLGQQLSWIWLVCGLGLLLMGLSSSWNDAAFSRPNTHDLRMYTGLLQHVRYSAPAKSPTLVEVVIYNKKAGLKQGYLRYGLHTWEERLKPYVHQPVTLWLNQNKQVWHVLAGEKTVISQNEILMRLQSMKQAQQDMAENIAYAGGMMVLAWLLFRARRTKWYQAYS